MGESGCPPVEERRALLFSRGDLYSTIEMKAKTKPFLRTYQRLDHEAPPSTGPGRCPYAAHNPSFLAAIAEESDLARIYRDAAPVGSEEYDYWNGYIAGLNKR